MSSLEEYEKYCNQPLYFCKPPSFIITMAKLGNKEAQEFIERLYSNKQIDQLSVHE